MLGCVCSCSALGGHAGLGVTVLPSGVLGGATFPATAGAWVLCQGELCFWDGAAQTSSTHHQHIVVGHRRWWDPPFTLCCVLQSLDPHRVRAWLELFIT